MGQNSGVQRSIQYSLEQNNTLILSVPTLFHYGSEYLLTLISTEVLSSVLSMVVYALATLVVTVLWYFLFWRPFDWNRVNTKIEMIGNSTMSKILLSN